MELCHNGPTEALEDGPSWLLVQLHSDTEIQ